jgi:hypothetical protein
VRKCCALPEATGLTNLVLAKREGEAFALC